MSAMSMNGLQLFFPVTFFHFCPMGGHHLSKSVSECDKLHFRVTSRLLASCVIRIDLDHENKRLFNPYSKPTRCLLSALPTAAVHPHSIAMVAHSFPYILIPFSRLPDNTEQPDASDGTLSAPGPVESPQQPFPETLTFQRPSPSLRVLEFLLFVCVKGFTMFGEWEPNKSVKSTLIVKKDNKKTRVGYVIKSP